MKGNFRDLLFILQTQWKESKAAVFLQIIQGLCIAFQNIPTIFFPALIIDEVLGNKDVRKIVLYVALFAILMLLPRLILGITEPGQFAYTVRMPHIFVLNLANKMFRIDYSETESESFLNRYDNACDKVFQTCEIVGKVVSAEFALLVKLFALTSIISTLHFWVVPLVLSVAIVNCVINMKERKITLEYGEKENVFRRKSGYAEDLLTSLEFAKDCRAYCAADFVSEKYTKERAGLSEVLIEKNRKLQRLDCLHAVLSFFQNGCLYLIMFLQYVAGAITVGAFTMYINAAYEFYFTIVQLLSTFVEQIKTTSLYFGKYRNFMELPETMRQTGSVMEMNLQEPPTIEFRNVSFRYPGREEYALRNVNLTIQPSELVAIVGENGAGKTTFVKLLTRLYDPTEGEIRVNGRDIREYDYDEYMKLFSPVFQDYTLFAYSIAENVAFDRYDAAKFEDASRKAGVWERIQRLPNGKETYIEKRYESSGVELSGGERQKVAIARAIYKNAPVAVLDEPTAAIDAIAEKEIYDRFAEFSAHKTTFFISHRMGSTKFCNHIIVLDQGEVVEEGSHKELLELKGIYFNLYEKQASYYN